MQPRPAHPCSVSAHRDRRALASGTGRGETWGWPAGDWDAVFSWWIFLSPGGGEVGRGQGPLQLSVMWPLPWQVGK